MNQSRLVSTKILGSAVVALNLVAFLVSLLVSFAVTAWISLAILNLGFVIVAAQLGMLLKQGAVFRPALAFYSLIYLSFLSASFAFSIFIPIWIWPINLIAVVIGTAVFYILTIATRHHSAIAAPSLVAEKSGYAFISNTARDLMRIEGQVTGPLVHRVKSVREQIEFAPAVKLKENEEVENQITELIAKLGILAVDNDESGVRKLLDQLSNLIRFRNETIRRIQ
jgi:hypothetical protein